MLQSKCENLLEDANKEGGMDSLDADTAISKYTFDAALHAAGAVCDGIDLVLSGKVRNAFCPVRPPGHHAGPRGLVRSSHGSDSHGFCFLNNISIGASYAMNRYRDVIKRVAIVDFDVHHGNGTEETGDIYIYIYTYIILQYTFYII
jgi:acetoin utilization deacetylase AcuC-like enzyme